MSNSNFGDGGYYASSDVRPTKRSKIEIACETCRLRKSRCDGGRPKCSACLKRRNVGPYCIYSASAYSVPPAMHTPKLNITSIPIAQDNATSLASINDTRLYNHQPPSQNQRSIFRGITITSSHSSPTTTSGEDVQNPNNTVDKPRSAESDWILQAGLLAASSSAKFFKTVFGSSNGEEAQRDNPTSNEARPSIDEHSYRTSGASTAYDLPRRKVADALLQLFWTHVYIQWIDRTEFETWYESLWSSDVKANDQVEEKIRYATLNMIFALIYRTEPDFEDDHDQLAQIHFGRAQELLHLNVLDLNHMDLLYALFLMLQWYQSVNDVKSCSELIKLCLLVAQNLGIDDVKNVSTFNQRKREMARRAWHGCILMDRIIAMVSGSSPRVPQNIAKQAPLFGDIDNHLLTVTGDDGVQPSGTPSTQGFFLHFCKLHLILGDILVEDHHTIDINHMVEIDKRLRDFDDALPHELRYGAAESQTLGQTIHLKTRYLYIQILLFRPCFTGLTESLKRGSSLRFSDLIMQQGVFKCISAARELLDLLDIRHSAGERGPGLIPQWWHTVAYVYTAATTMIAAHIFPAVLETYNNEDLGKSIQQGFSILDSYKRYREPAQRCRRALQILHSRYVVHEMMQQQSEDAQNEVIDISWAWEGLPELFADGGMFDLDFAGEQ